MNWEIHDKKYNLKNVQKYETLFTLANGYRGIRGYNELSSFDNRGNFVAGIFDKSNAQVKEIVNLPDPLEFKIYSEDEIITLDSTEILKYDRYLNMKEATLNLETELKTPKGKIINIKSKRFVSRFDEHLMMIKYEITPINFDGKLTIQNTINSNITNSKFDPINKSKHYKTDEIKDLENGLYLQVKTNDSKSIISQWTGLYSENIKNRKFYDLETLVEEVYEIYVKKSRTYKIQKNCLIHTSRNSKTPKKNILNDIKLYKNSSFEEEFKKHIKEMQKIWKKIDITIDGDDKAQTGLRFNLFHLISCAYQKDPTVSIGAKGLHGEGYKGHIFWDTEIFMLPFFTYTYPEIARSLLLYRFNTLKGAKENAKNNGYNGAQFPWESADIGLEETPKWGIDYLGNPVRIWTGDEEFHISSDIALAYWQYFKATNDKEFMENYGYEIFIETTKFWESRLTHNEDKDYYEIKKVIGPDEFHEHVDNNFYTNYLAKWNIKKCCEIIEKYKIESPKKYEDLIKKTNISEKNINNWKNIYKKIFLSSKNDIIEQFEGYFNLKDYKIKKYDENEMPLWPENIELDKLNQTQLIKQPDVIMLLLILGEEFEEEIKRKNYEYYEKRTMHKSSLSPSMYSIMGLKIGDTHNAYNYFIKTIMTDIQDNQKNTALGLHAASTGGSWQSIVYGFGGFSIDKNNIPNFNPWIPKKWKSLNYKINWQNNVLNINITENTIIINSEREIEIKIKNKSHKLKKGTNKFYLN
ncbi:kojibiose phosphorylase [Oceanotoga teriensis]|uniref:Kojibiose phosphorylase n=1 Tax=Oceanotoga teriensis TaxID=515440 RepID=A0AA45C585_9BACT|nr:glycosyl hydrolase family 65 protein [Oceanotoga teriensis]PWJ88256.1 kojibiose phosphorylase [Oceanotoga teriensis]